MKYYILTTPSDPKLIGVKNGIYQAEIDKKKYKEVKDYNKLLSFFSGIGWFEREQIPDFPITIHAKLLKSAIKTDVIQFAPHLTACPFIVHEKVKQVLSSYRLQEHFFYSANIYNQKDDIDGSYYLFFTPYQEYDIVDFSKSIFFSGNHLIGKKYFSCATLEDYRAKRKELSISMGIEKLVLNNNFDKSLDLFCGRIGEMYISERLKDSILSANLTGIKIVEAKEPEIVIS